MAKELTYERECGENDELFKFYYEVEPYVAAKLYGLPENCSPEEGGYATVYKVCRADGSELPRESWKAAGIDIEQIEELIYVEWSDGGQDDDPPDPRED
jgi:hypothetical protein